MPSAPDSRRRRLRNTARAGLLLAGTVLLSGCSTDKIPAFGMPEPVTKQGHEVIALWKGASVAALLVGIVTWGLMGWCVVAYRKRTDDLPAQVHYNLPIEILYTVLPCAIIAVLFWFTAVDEKHENRVSKHPDMIVNVVGYRWAWEFDYQSGPAPAAADPAAGLQVHGRVGQFPTLVLPVGERIRFNLTSPDVIHAFWVPEFDFKRDVVPGRTNTFDLTIEKTGTWPGRCTELCGVYHDRMLFTLRAVSQADYAAWAQKAITEAKAQGASNGFVYTPAAAGSQP
jgi:cytochrome c oxidase subunit II